MRIALTWLAPFVQMDREDQAAALQARWKRCGFQKAKESSRHIKPPAA